MRTTVPSEEDMKRAYLLLLDRAVESPAIMAWLSRSVRTYRDLRTIILSSPEFRQNNSGLLTEEKIGNKPAMDIQAEYTQDELARLFAHIQSSWQSLGSTEPHWSVLSSEDFRKERIEESEPLFYASGENELSLIKQTLARNNVDIAKLRSCLEFGCGLGRVTFWLAQQFERVDGYDISSSHLALASRYMDEKGVGNVRFTHLAGVGDLALMPKVDFVFTVIVLQHNPPPVIAQAISALLAALNAGGVALFQVPIYRSNYQFSVRSYLENLSGSGDIEMHVIPQREVFRIIREQGCELLEVASDDYAGGGNGIFSNTFLVRRPSALSA